jgi:hypothetical protein
MDLLKVIFGFGLLWIISGCVKAPEYSPVPFLRFDGLSKSSLLQGTEFQDSLLVFLYFTDGDGDFGSPANSSERNIFIVDKRTGNIKDEFKAPLVPEQGVNNGISGKISVKIYSTCCIFPEQTGIPPCQRPQQFPDNDLILDIYIKDRAGNISNTVSTDVIKLICR